MGEILSPLLRASSSKGYVRADELAAFSRTDAIEPPRTLAVDHP
jgi:hypothetical protein